MRFSSCGRRVKGLIHPLSRRCGRSSGVEHNLAKVRVGRSNRLARSIWIVKRARFGAPFCICRDAMFCPLAPLRALDYLGSDGGWAGRLCTGLQIHEDRFDSGTRLQIPDKFGVWLTLL